MTRIKGKEHLQYTYVIALASPVSKGLPWLILQSAEVMAKAISMAKYLSDILWVRHTKSYNLFCADARQIAL